MESDCFEGGDGNLALGAVDGIGLSQDPEKLAFCFVQFDFGLYSNTALFPFQNLVSFSEQYAHKNESCQVLYQV